MLLMQDFQSHLVSHGKQGDHLDPAIDLLRQTSKSLKCFLPEISPLCKDHRAVH